MNFTSNQDYYESLKTICEYLIENKTKTEYVLNCFYQQESHDLDEMSKAEGNLSQAQKFELRMLSKKEQTDSIKQELTNFKNEKFRTKVAEFLQWVSFQLDPPSMFAQKYPSDLKNCLSKVKRYESDTMVMTEDINRKFKHMSPNRNTPTP